MVKQWKPATSLSGPQKSKCTVLVVGKRNRGKSTLMVDIARHIACPKAIVLSATDKCSHFYEQFFPKSFIYDRYDEDILKKIISVQKDLVKQDSRMSKSGMLLIVDDTGYDKKFLKTQAFAEILMNGRWYNISVVVGIQDAASMPLNLRAQMDYVCCLAESFRNGQERLYNWFFGIYPSFKMFRDAFVEITKDYGALVLDNVSTDVSDISKTVFWYTANPRLRFRYGSRDYQSSR
jgi:hypothetical protein